MDFNMHFEGAYEAYCFEKLPNQCKVLFMDYLMNAQKHDLVGAPLFVKENGLMVSEQCGSPIEEILDFAMQIYIFEVRKKGKTFPIPQHQYKLVANEKNYIADFYFDSDYAFDSFKGKNRVRLVVECDGHDFHEKTSAQVNNNNKRDYNLRMEGYDVIHFSGSRIFKDSLRCVREIYDFVNSKVGEWNIKEDGDVMGDVRS